MINRYLSSALKEAASQLPVVALLGPRQSGKTTLAQTTFNEHLYVSLENLDIQTRAIEDPQGFLEYYSNSHGIILDEIQHVPSLLSYIQTYVDKHKVNGGSENQRWPDAEVVSWQSISTIMKHVYKSSTSIL